MRYLLLILFLLLPACGNDNDKPSSPDTSTGQVEEEVNTSPVEVIPPPEPIRDSPIVVKKDEIEENTYQITDARKLSGLQSIKYDIYFKAAMSWQMPYIDWKWLKAQCWQESRFNPKAVSPVGAAGVCQFMPGTWEGVPIFVREDRDVWDARTNIDAAAWYMNTRYNFWTSPRPQLDRIQLAQACYNAGCGHVLNAQKKCNNPSGYDEIIECLPLITGDHSKETIDYVQKIGGFARELNVIMPKD